jgi:hypothetical protein
MASHQFLADARQLLVLPVEEPSGLLTIHDRHGTPAGPGRRSPGRAATGPPRARRGPAAGRAGPALAGPRRQSG